MRMSYGFGTKKTGRQGHKGLKVTQHAVRLGGRMQNKQLRSVLTVLTGLARWNIVSAQKYVQEI